MTLESAWIYEIHYFQLKFVSIYRKEVKIIAITYFLVTLPILPTKIAITRIHIKIPRLLVYLKSILNKVTKISFLQLFSLLFILKSLQNGQNREFLKNSNWNMPKAPGKMHMCDMVEIETIVLQPPPPPGSLAV